MFAIIDCNNFYASCERLFRPDLIDQPIIVLSNNDGCVIARSNEAKALNIKMGQPFFQIKSLCKYHGVHVFSSNYTLYGDLSARVMQVIEEEWPEVEIYSIDEAFLNLNTLPQKEIAPFCKHLRQKIWQHVGIPTSIGLGASKTLAKAANYIAKKSKKISVFQLELDKPWLELIPIEDIWGIGHQWSKKLKSLGIHTAADLKQQSPHLIRQRFSLPLMQTTLELQGFACHELQAPQKRHSIMASRSFGQSQNQIEYLMQAISHHCARATQKLREQKGKVSIMSIFIRTNPFQKERAQYANRQHIQLLEATDDLRIITTCAKDALKKIFKPNFDYQKVGVCFEQIEYHEQTQLFTNNSYKKSQQFMDILNEIQQKYGRKSIYLAAEGTTHPWTMKSEKRSPAYTTSWIDLPIVKCISETSNSNK
jgi:DNA polymerase V